MRRGARHREQGYDDSDAGALAVAGGDEIGNRGDAVRLGNPHQLAKDEEGADENERGDEIDGGELGAVARRRAYSAEERPGGAVDRQWRCIAHGRAALTCTPPRRLTVE